MFEQIHSNPDIYKIPVFLPNNPLKIFPPGLQILLNAFDCIISHLEKYVNATIV